VTNVEQKKKKKIKLKIINNIKKFKIHESKENKKKKVRRE